MGGDILKIRILKIKSFAIYLSLYAVLVVLYFLLVLRFLGEPLERLFHESLPLYTGLALVLIVGQGILLEYVTSFIIDRFGHSMDGL